MPNSIAEHFRRLHRRGVIVCVAAAIAFVCALWFWNAAVLSYRENFTLYFSSDVHGLFVGSPVQILGQNIGQVEKIGIAAVPAADGRGSDYFAAVTIVVDSKKFARYDGLRDGETFRDALPRLLALGLRGRLLMPSMLADGLCVDLHFAPETPQKFIVPANAAFPEIPVHHTANSEYIDRTNAFVESGALNGISEKIRGMKTLAADFEKFAETLDCASLNAQTLAVLEKSNSALDPAAVRRNLSELNCNIEALCGEIERGNGVSRERAGEFRDSVQKFSKMTGEICAATKALKEQSTPDEVDSRRAMFDELRNTLAPIVELGKTLFL